MKVSDQHFCNQDVLFQLPGFFSGDCLSLRITKVGGYPVGVVVGAKKFVTNLSHLTPKTGNY